MYSIGLCDSANVPDMAGTVYTDSLVCRSGEQ